MTKTIEIPEILLPPEIKNDLTRRDFLAAAGAAMLLGGCGGSENSGEADSSGDTRTISHKYGETEISGMPERIVTVGATDHDTVLAFGVVPVGITDWYGGGRGQIFWPWAEDTLGDSEPEIVGMLAEPNFEAIAAAEPDLILGLRSGLTGDQFDTLSEIAPTVAQPGEFADYAVPWQDMTRITGRALGRGERAEELIGGIEARFSEVRGQHPEFEGATAVTAGFNGPGDYVVFGPEDSRTQLLEAIGFVYPDEIAEEADPGRGLGISAERFDLLDVDALIWFTSGDSELVGELAESEIYQRLAVARENRDIFLEEDDEILDGALSFSTVLSIPYAVERLVPMLEATLDGDHETTVED